MKKETNMKPFGISLQGRVKNFRIPVSQPLFPVFEAIINSFHAIDERREKDFSYTNPFITIEIVRDGQLALLDSDEKNAIKSVYITDNGIGFNSLNFESFLESDSTYKAAIGGKGVGRLSWLVAFEKASIDSIFQDEDGNTVKRTFDFLLSSNGIEDELTDYERTENRTCVKLLNLKNDYQKNAPKQLSTIAARILQHCLIYFMDKNCPKVIIKDEDNSIDLNKLYEERIKPEENFDRFSIDGNEFELLHVKAEEVSTNQNQLFLCANNRLVEVKDLSKSIIDLDRSLYDKHGFWYIGVLKGRYLDESVDMNRLSFSIPEGGFVKGLPGILSMDQIVEESSKLIHKYLYDFILPISEEKIDTIKEYVTNTAPQFRHLLKYMPEDIKRIRPNLSPDKLDDELHKIKRKFDREIRDQNQKILCEFKEGVVSSDEYKERFNTQIKKVVDANSATLAEYVAHRKIIIELLAEAIYRQDNDKYVRESYIHNLIFPMRSTSDEQAYESHNLWLLDEKLSYCSYISSDIPFDNNPKEKRTDIMMLDHPVAASEDTNDGTEYDTIIVFEIKRPMRDDYTDNDNPLLQLYRYVDRLKTNSVKDKNGRIVHVGNNTKFYLYAICDVTDKLKDVISHSGLLKKTPDQLGYYGYHSEYNAFIEILPFDKIINDATKRNRVLFDKLGI